MLLKDAKGFRQWCLNLEVEFNRDETGRLEEASWDLFPLISSCETLHLDENGLPKIGTVIRPKMILVGKMGRSRSFDESDQPDALEIHGRGEEWVRSRYGHMWVDGSVYATLGTVGKVAFAQLIERDGRKIAVIELDDMPSDHELSPQTV